MAQMTRTVRMAQAKGDGRRRAAGRPAWRIRRARRGDLAALAALEAAAFQPYRRASRASLRRSLSSPRQEVWVVDAPRRQPAPARQPTPEGLAALLVLWRFPHRWRVYDVAVRPGLQGHGLGTLLMRHAEGRARRAGAAWMSLEADPREPHLVSWYLHRGYRPAARLPGYYRNGNAAVRLVKGLR